MFRVLLLNRAPQRIDRRSSLISRHAVNRSLESTRSRAPNTEGPSQPSPQHASTDNSVPVRLAYHTHDVHWVWNTGQTEGKRGKGRCDIMHYHLSAFGQFDGSWRQAEQAYRRILRNTKAVNFITVVREPRSHLLRCDDYRTVGLIASCNLTLTKETVFYVDERLEPWPSLGSVPGLIGA